MPLGALSKRTSKVRLPSPRDVYIIIHEIINAAYASAFGIPKNKTVQSPTITIEEEIISALKCRASASMA